MAHNLKNAGRGGAVMIGLSGIKGEKDAFDRMLEVVARLPLEVFNNKILKGAEREREADLVCVGQRKIYVFEVKNMGGRITHGGRGRWIQTKDRGRTREISDGFAQATGCSAALARHIKDECGITLDDKRIEARVLFTNPDVDVSGLEEAGRLSITLEGLERFVYFNELCGPALEGRDEIIAALARAKGMCIVALRGEDGLTADILRGEIECGIFYNEITYGPEGMIDYAATFCRTPAALDRSDLVYLRFKGFWRGAAKAEIKLRSRQGTVEAFINNDKFLFRPRGMEPVVIEMSGVEQIACC